jgi:DNA modification methylase
VNEPRSEKHPFPVLPKPYFCDSAVTIYHGDCRKIVPFLPRFDLLLTDPPYGIGASSGVGKFGRLKWTAGDSKWDESVPPPWLLDMLLESASKHIIWGGNYYTLPPSRQYLVWDKGAGFKDRDFAECEQAWCSMDGNAKVYARDPLACGDYRGKEHPTAKPVALMTWCLELVPDAKTVLDPFGGSGSTARACKDLGRNCVLIEREERYCEVAARRMGQEVLALGAA